MSEININKLEKLIQENIRGREMPYTVSFTDAKGGEGFQVYNIAVTLTPRMTYEDLAEELVSYTKTLFTGINYRPQHKEPHVIFKEWYQGEISTFQKTTVVLHLLAKVESDAPLEHNTIVNNELQNI
jgi:hypothetical protein